MHSYKTKPPELWVARCVLILVLMEDALVRPHRYLLERDTTGQVLILVLMEDALVLSLAWQFVKKNGCLNPCFNGRCTRTGDSNGVFATKQGVLILVLMEDALVRKLPSHASVSSSSLNPCFNGRCTRTILRRSKIITDLISLNPCFNGRCTRTCAGCGCGVPIWDES